MKWFTPALLLTLFCTSKVQAKNFDAVVLVNKVLELVSNRSFLNNPKELQCLTTAQSSPFQNKNELIDFMCRSAATMDDESLKKELTERGADKALGAHSIDELIKGFRTYHEFNATIPEMFNVTTPHDWKLGDQNMKEYPCEYRVAEGSQKNFHQMNYKTDSSLITFIGSKHFSSLTPENLPGAKVDLETKLSSVKPDALLVEGKEFGQPIACGTVLSDALAEDAELKSEMRATIKYGFWNQIPLIPADNQEIDENDLAFFGNSEFAMNEAKESFAYMKTLHLYHDLLAQGNSSDLALNEALSKSGQSISSENFKSLYQTKNERDLPKVAADIKQDFSPSIVAKTKRASNYIADKQNEIRNQALVKAMQIASKKFKNPAVMYGSGHLGQIGKTLEEKMGKPTNVDFDSACKP